MTSVQLLDMLHLKNCVDHENFLSHVIQKEVAPKYDMRLKDDCLLFNFRQPVLPHCSNPVTVTSLSFLIPHTMILKHAWSFWIPSRTGYWSWWRTDRVPTKELRQSSAVKRAAQIMERSSMKSLAQEWLRPNLAMRQR